MLLATFSMLATAEPEEVLRTHFVIFPPFLFLQSYLSVTLRSLLENMSEEESADCLMVVMVAEADAEYAKSVAEEIKTQFPEAVESGLIEVISPPASYYPQWSNLKRTLVHKNNDSLDNSTCSCFCAINFK